MEFLHLVRHRLREVGIRVPKRAGGDPGNKVQVFLMGCIGRGSGGENNVEDTNQLAVTRMNPPLPMAQWMTRWTSVAYHQYVVATAVVRVGKVARKPEGVPLGDADCKGWYRSVQRQSAYSGSRSQHFHIDHDHFQY